MFNTFKIPRELVCFIRFIFSSMSKNACSMIGLFCSFSTYTEGTFQIFSEEGAKYNNVCLKNPSDLCLAQFKSTKLNTKDIFLVLQSSHNQTIYPPNCQKREKVVGKFCVRYFRESDLATLAVTCHLIQLDRMSCSSCCY